LAGVDGSLDDSAFFAPFVAFFDARIGRPSTPMETYLRLIFLKFRYRLGYESLCREVSLRADVGTKPARPTFAIRGWPACGDKTKTWQLIAWCAVGLGATVIVGSLFVRSRT
jgi:IS5 family transposase